MGDGGPDANFSIRLFDLPELRNPGDVDENPG